MIKNIISLTKISARNLLENYDLVKKGQNKLNRKSVYFWLILIVIVAITLISNKIIDILQDANQLEVFPGILMALVTVIMFMQTILLSINVLYFSKDIESLLPLAIKSEELLISKMNTILTILYGTELIFTFIPLILYGVSAGMGIGYYISEIVVLVLFPIFPATTITLISLIVMKFIKKIKHKNAFQIIITLLFVIIIVVVEVLSINWIMAQQNNYAEIGVSIKSIADNINKTLFVGEPLVSILQQQNIWINLLKVLGIYAILIFLLILIGKKIYIKNILKLTAYNKSKVIKKVDFDTQCKPESVYKAYMKNEFNNLLKNAIFFMQTIFPVCMTVISLIFLAIYFKIGIIDKIQELSDLLVGLNLNMEGVCIILGLAQILYSLVSISITSISRMGKNAIFMKFIPVNLYKQFLIKNIPQILINIILLFIILISAKIFFPLISIVDLICIFVLGVVLSILNSYLMLIVDIKRPILNWKAEVEVFKQNDNKIFQYVWTIVVVVILMYIRKVCETANLYVGFLAIFIVFSLILFIVDKYVRKAIKNNKLFKNVI